MPHTVLILGGNGKTGFHAAAAFKNIGWTVRHFDRAKDDMITASQGVDVIVNGLNPPMYHDWDTQIPAITDQVITAAKASGATVILPGNIYNFGLVNGEIDENTPHNPNSRKGAIRVAMEDRYRTSGVQTIILRAGNFIDPNRNGDVFSMVLLRGKAKVTAPADPDTRQAYAYTPDWGRAAALLAAKRGHLGTFEDIPFPGHSFTYDDLRTHLSAVTGQPYHLARFPWWSVRLAAPFVEVARELLEMRYLYGMNHWIGSAKFDRLLPDFEPTPLAEVMNAGVEASDIQGVFALP